MKIAFATDGKSLEDKIALHFGRAKNFLVYDAEKKDFESFTNPEIVSQALPPDFLHDLGIAAVVVFSLGPNAYKKFQGYGIKMYKAKEGSVLDNIKLFEQGKLFSLKEKDIF